MLSLNNIFQQLNQGGLCCWEHQRPPISVLTFSDYLMWEQPTTGEVMSFVGSFVCWVG